MAAALGHLRAVAVLDRAESFSTAGGSVFAEVRSALYSLAVKETEPSRLPLAVNFIYGLGGRDLNPGHVRKVFERLAEIARTGRPGETVSYLGVRE